MTLALHSDPKPALERHLVDRLQPVLRARIRRFTRHRRGRAIGVQDEDDLLQAAWCRLMQEEGRRLSGFDPLRGVSLEGYVGVLTDRLLIDLSRRSCDRRPAISLEEAGTLAADEGSPESRALAQQELARLWAHLEAALPARGRAVARLLYQEHHDSEEAAQALGVSKQVIANWKHRIKRLARAFRTGDCGARRKSSAGRSYSLSVAASGVPQRQGAEAPKKGRIE